MDSGIKVYERCMNMTSKQMKKWKGDMIWSGSVWESNLYFASRSIASRSLSSVTCRFSRVRA